MAGLKGYDAGIKRADGTPVSFTDEACTDTGDHTTYVITDTDMRYWNPDADVIVERDTGGGFTLVASSEYTLEKCGGRVVFEIAQGASDDIQVTGEYLPVSTVGGGLEWSMDIERNVVDDSEFGDAWEVPEVMLGKASGSLKLKWADASWFENLDAGDLIVLVLMLNTGDLRRYETFARVTKDSISNAHMELVGEEIGWVGSGRPYSRTGA